MRTGLFLLAGLLMLASFVILARMFAANFPAAGTWATAAFILVWLLIAAFNMWVGVVRAGYSVAEELPILLLLFGVPAAVAVLVKWKFL